MGSPVRFALAFALLAAACGTPPTPGSTPVTASPAPAATPPPTSGPAGPAKPSAPIDLNLTARPVAGDDVMDRFEVVLVATPRTSMAEVALIVDGGRAVPGSTLAGEPSEVRTTVAVARGAGRDIIATASVLVDGQRMGAATMIRVGAPAAEPAGALIQLPDGTWVQEARP